VSDTTLSFLHDPARSILHSHAAGPYRYGVETQTRQTIKPTQVPTGALSHQPRLGNTLAAIDKASDVLIRRFLMSLSTRSGYSIKRSALQAKAAPQGQGPMTPRAM
jgi:hypothetical protein